MSARPTAPSRRLPLLALALLLALLVPVPRAEAGGSYNGDPTELIVFGSTGAGRGAPPIELTDYTRTIRDVSAGYDHVLAVDGNGRLFAWGDDAQGEGHIPVALQSQSFKAVSAGLDYSLALTINGKVRAWGASMPALPPDLDDYTFTAISAGGSFAMALDSNGVVHAWGNDLWGQTEVPQEIQGKTTRISAGGAFALATTSDRKVVAWGSNLSGERNVPASLQGASIDEIDAGTRHAVVLLTDARIVTWGDNSAGQLDIPTTDPDLRYWHHVSAGTDFTVAASTRSTRIQVWGEGATTTFANAPTVSPAPARLTAGGTFAVLGNAKLVESRPGSISGTGRVGDPLTATLGTFKPLTPTRTWASWRLAGGPDIAIGDTFTPTPDMVGKQLVLDTRGERAGYHIKSNSTGIIVRPGLMKPTTPTITGKARIGRTITADVVFSPQPDRLQYDWHVDGVFQQATAGPDYVVRPGDLGKRITVSVAGFKDGFETHFSGMSAPTPAVTADPPLTVTQATRIPTTTRVDQTVVPVDPVSSPAATSITYQWLRDGMPIDGATDRRYTPTVDDIAHELSLAATLHREDYAPTESRSNAVRPGFGTWVSKSSVPAVTGDRRVGGTLTARATFDPQPDMVSYEWKVGDEVVTGHTAATFQLTAAHHGRTVSVRATALKAGYLPEQTGWLTTPTIPRQPAQAITFLAPPAVSGRAVTGQVLTARPPRTSVDARLTYQWLRAGAPIPGATGIRYRLGAADVGRQITVQTVAQRDGWHPAGAASAPTPAVAKAGPKVRAKARSRRGRTLVTVRVSAPGLTIPAAKVVVRAGKKVVARGTLTGGRAILAVRKRTSGRLVVTISPTAVTAAARAKARPR